MFTTGSKFLIGATTVTTLVAIAYGVTQDNVMGTVALASAAVALAFLATINAILRDSNVFVSDDTAVATCAASVPAPGRSVWPIGMALALVVLVLGLVTYPVVFIVGLVLVLASGGEWMFQAWSERASGDAAHNSEVRLRMAGPLEFPLAGALAVGVLVYAFSRIMLWLSATNTVIAFAVLGGFVLLFAFFFAFKTTMKKTVVAGVSAFAVVGLVAGGVAAGVDGEREIHPHETTSDLVEEGEDICESPDHFEIDEDGSQTVSMSADVAATFTLEESGELSLDVPGGVESGATALQLPRSNPSNIIFVNKSSHDRRLSVDLGLIEVTTEEGATGLVANQTCTTLVEEDGEQLITITVSVPSAAQDGGYRFFVPGVDGAEVELVVL